MYSEDSTQDQGGDWGWVNRRTLNDNLAKIAFALKPGQVSQIIELGNSYFLLLVEQKKVAETKPLSAVRDEIERELLQQQRQAAMTEWAAKLRKKALAGMTLAVSLLLAVVGFRFGSARSCPTDQSQGWFGRVIESRIVDARETLRETRTFGPIIEELFPAPMTMTAGAMVAMPPTPPPAP